MDLRFAPLRMRTLDTLRAELAVLPFFNDERPLRALAGLCDWRLCGRLSRLLLTQRLHSTTGVITLTPAGKRLPFERLLFVGLGDSASFDRESYDAACASVSQTLLSLRVRTAAVTIPGRSLNRSMNEEWMREFLSILHPAIDELDQLTVVDHPDSLRILSPVLEAKHQQLRAQAFRR